MTTSAPTTDIPSQYDPAAIEQELYARWQEAGVYHAHAERSNRVGGDREPFVIVMPPPNVTAILHVGHGLNNTVQDVIVRWRRMAGDETLWLPGTDHAGIATQNVVEKLIAGEGKTRFDLGREAFVARTAQFVEETGGAILGQLRAIGASADWTRTAYTLSPELSLAVREAFVRLYERGLIYKGHRVIHWCPRCLTSLSDEEAEFEDTPGKLYHISYPLASDPSRSLSVATTRPETMLGDVAVAVHPEDERYRDLIGQKLVLPIVGIEIPIVADTYVDPAFGTGVVKITPAHDPNDFEMGRRHALPMPVIMTPTGLMQDGVDSAGRVPAELRGVDRFEARDTIVEMLRAAGRLEKVENHQHAVRHCYRCDTVVEPRLSDQWFVKMEPLARPALEAVRSGEVRILPERWEAVYVNWLEGIRDWNISRQLWWGHRIPVWYCEKDGTPHASRADLVVCPDCGGPVRQDEDVLDTWFSSWLWPLSTLGWPDEQALDLRAFYPTDVLITAPEILFFWVARMIMAGFAFAGRTPFHTVYLHGTARDTNHVKMSKSLGNGIDPLEVVKLYGADAMRYTLIAGMGMGADVILDPKDLERSFATGRNFATKLWNIGRFLLTNVGAEPVTPLAEVSDARLTRADRWVLARLDAAVADCDAALGPSRPPKGDRWRPEERFAGLRLNEYTEAARRFVWSELADWYVESIKGRLTGEDAADRDVARAVAVHAFDMALRLLHPVMPFITEALWQRLPGHVDGTFVTNAPWPTVRATTADAAAADFDLVRDAVVAVRQIRSDYNVPPGKQVEATLVPPRGARAATVLREEATLVGRLTRSAVRVADAAPDGAAAQKVLADGSEAYVMLAGLVDVEKECKRARDELAGLEKQLAGLRQRLSNESFLARAKPEVVEAERAKEREWTARGEQLARKVASLCGA
ncbi:MAG TPA: valine--tRNA ligase [Gemmatimonadaceae bacterium]|nr:valine--tRNA ligase [Gemmatimonadaceae bacterium]